MAASELLQLFDLYWFKHEILTGKLYSSSSSSSSSQSAVHEIQEISFQELDLPKSSSFHHRSISEQSSSSTASFSSENISPNSVLTMPNLKTILSGKVEEFSRKTEEEENRVGKEVPMKIEFCERKRMRRKGESKSLSDLEFEELKGFMDLGFVFSEEDEDSRLISIIPGLQRLRRREGCINGGEAIDEPKVSRPYLSEAWDLLERRKEENPLLKNWRLPDVSNEIDMKNHLKFWAHSVASAVR
ncbi:hypothetical protein Nepgr_013985 [Nepenthes gracilis]|uniref:Uncharacterized protein n=1 Tax=Nepenthes gracilis TaxID=150966 RepID=A0AAD3SJX4_NEPGR|nr:hypothetical protein Nepgr_013985 [Nepenthes gracilis]